MFALGMAAGPVVGGVLVPAFWWGAVFLIAVPVALLVLLAAPALLPEYRSPCRSARPAQRWAVAGGDAADHLRDQALRRPTVIDPQAIVAVLCRRRRRRRLRPPPTAAARIRCSTCTSSRSRDVLGGAGRAVGRPDRLRRGDVPGHPVPAARRGPLAAGRRGCGWGRPPWPCLIGAIGAPLLAASRATGHRHGGDPGRLPARVRAARPSPGPTARGAWSSASRSSISASGVIAALGTDIVVGAAPPERSGSAAALSETVQELGIAAGVAILGSLTTALYRSAVEAPAGLSAAAAETYRRQPVRRLVAGRTRCRPRLSITRGPRSPAASTSPPWSPEFGIAAAALASFLHAATPPAARRGRAGRAGSR